MDLFQVMRTAFACRDFQDEIITDEVLHRILDQARFAPSGGNRQASHVIVVKDRDIKNKLGELCKTTLSIYAAQRAVDEVPFNTVNISSVDPGGNHPDSKYEFPLFDNLREVPALLVVSVDLAQVASMDKDLDRIGLATGASVYPLVWNIILAARNEGLGGVITTALIPKEVEALKILGLPESHAIAAMIPMGKPKKQLSVLRRNEVEEFVTVDSYLGDSFGKGFVNELED